MRARYTLADAIRDHRTRHWSATPECRRNGRFGVVVDLEIAVLTKAVDELAATHRARVHGWRDEEGEPSSPSGPRRRAHLSRPQVAACTFAFSPPGACRPAGFAASGAHNNGRRCVRTNAAKPNRVSANRTGAVSVPLARDPDGAAWLLQGSPHGCISDVINNFGSLAERLWGIPQKLQPVWFYGAENQCKARFGRANRPRSKQQTGFMVHYTCSTARQRPC